MPLVFAYGSNMLRERLRARCPGIVFAGRATLADHRLTFDKVSDDKSGKGALGAAAGEIVHGGLWQVPDDEMVALDDAEGRGYGYERSTIGVAAEDGTTCDVLVYRATKVRPGLRPYEWYLALVIAGAMEHDLPGAYIDKLRAQPFDVDPDLGRKRRLDALAALKAAGRMEVLDDLVR